MDLTPYVEALRTDLGTAAAAGTEETRALAGLLAAALEPALRLCLVDALSAMAAEVTEASDVGTVEIRMHGREPQVVVTAGEPTGFAPIVVPPTVGPSGAEDDEERGTARVTLRLPDPLKALAEERAAAEGLSVNSWLVRLVGSAVRATPDPRRPFDPRQPPTTRPPTDRGRRLTGFARG